MTQTSPQKVALITGVTGQDGAYLSELLLDKGYEVHGIKRRSSLFNTDRIDHLYQDPHVDHQRFKLHYGNLTDSTNLTRIIQQVQPNEICNLAAMSHVAVVNPWTNNRGKRLAPASSYSAHSTGYLPSFQVTQSRALT